MGEGRSKGRPGLRLLLMDTCGAEASIALVELLVANQGSPVVETVELGGRVASERLIPELRRLMTGWGWRVGDLAAVGVVAGPGSFTGVRVGVAAAKGLCEAGAAPLVMVSRLAVLAAKAGTGAGRMQALLDAGRGEFFYGRFEDGEAPLEALMMREAVLAAMADGGRLVVCEEAARSAFAEFDPVMVAPLRAVDALGLVVARVEEGALDDVATSDANYLRRTDLEVLERLAQRARLSEEATGS